MHSRFVCHLSKARRIAGAVAVIALLSACTKPATVEELYPKLALTSVDGTQTSIEAFRGKLLVLNVWATWCPPCRREMPSLERLSKTVDRNRIVVAGLSVDNDANAVLEFLVQTGVTFRNFRDTPGNIINALDVQVYPETLLIAPDGKLVHRILGERDWSSPVMLRVLEEAYQGRRSELDQSLAGALAP